MKAGNARLAVPLFVPRVRRPRIATLLPVATLGVGTELDPVDPLCTLVGVLVGRDDTERATVVRRQLLAVEGPRQEQFLAETVLEWEIGRIVVECRKQHVDGIVSDSGLIGKLQERNAGKRTVERTPPSDTMKILSLGFTRQGTKVIPGKA